MRAAISITLSLVLGACGKGGGELPEARAFPPPDAPQAITIIERGEAGRVLRFAPKAGAGADTVRADVTVSSTVKGPQSMTIEMGLDLLMSNRILDAGGDGSFRMQSKIEDAKARLGGELAKMGASPEMMGDVMRGLATNVTIDARGRMLSWAIEGDNPMVQQMQMGLDKAFQSGFVPLPEEAVGPGAVWDALGHMDAMGVKARLAARYELLALDGSKARLEVSMRGAADPQKTRLPNAPVDVELGALEIEGGGTMTIDLERPTRGEMDLTMNMKASMEAQGQDLDMAVSMRMKAKPE